MKTRLVLPVVLCTLFFLQCCCCCAVPYFPPKITGRYLLYNDDELSGYSIATSVGFTGSGWLYECVVPNEVVEIGWNDEFILAKQHPREYFEPANTAITHWYIIDVKNERVYGPLTQPQFLEKKRELGVPQEIELVAVEAAR